MIKKVCAVYFSPTGGTRKMAMNIAQTLADQLGMREVECYDFTLPAAREKNLTFDEESLVVLASPVYAGRIPNKIMPYVRDCIRGNGALSVVVSVYGNRSFDDALQEMFVLSQDAGFKVIGAAGCVAEHTMSSGRMAAGRPNEDDLQEGREFADKIAAMVQSGDYLQRDIVAEIPGNYRPQIYYRPLGIDGNPAVFLKAIPKVREEICISCGKCAELCPVGSVQMDGKPVMKSPCIKCHACVKACPVGAIYFDDLAMLSHIEMIATNFAREEKANLWVL